MRILPAAILVLSLTIPSLAPALSLDPDAAPVDVELNQIVSPDSVISNTLPMQTEELADGADESRAPPVPEPGSMVLLGAGFLGLAVYGKRRKNF